MKMEPLPFGQSHWDYLPVEIQEHILDLAARSLHRDRMKLVCRSIQEHAHWRDDCLFKKTFSQRCEECWKIFSPELSMPRHRAICKGYNVERDYLALLLADTPDSYLSVHDRFEDMYGFYFHELFGSGETEDEDEGGHEPILWRPSNM